MTRHHISCLVNSMVADGLGTWRARVSIGMVLSVNREYPGVDTRRVKPFQAELILGNKNIYILYHFSTVQWCRLFNSLAPGRFEWNFKHIIFRLILMIDGWGICTIALGWMSLDPSDEKSTLVQVMAWCCQATSHYHNQCWPRSKFPYGVIRPH